MPPFKIAVHLTEINFRGSTVATLAYSRGLQAFGIDLLFVAPLFWGHQESAVNQVKSLGELYYYEDWESLELVLDRRGVDAIYVLKSGSKDHLVSKAVPTWVHAVFPTPITGFHGDKFAFISEWLANFSSCGVIPYIPHAVRSPLPVPGLREELSIPQPSLVLGYYGGENSFDIHFAKVALKEALDARKDLYTIFLNVRPFFAHERALFLAGTSDLTRKDQFVTACDAMIHARSIGETFGVACAEFSAANKPVITYAHSHQKAHLHMLKDKALTYSGYTSLKDILLNLDRVRLAEVDWNAFRSGYDEATVTEVFLRVFRSPVIRRPGIQTKICVSTKSLLWRIERQWRKTGFIGFEGL